MGTGRSPIRSTRATYAQRVGELTIALDQYLAATRLMDDRPRPARPSAPYSKRGVERWRVDLREDSEAFLAAHYQPVVEALNAALSAAAEALDLDEDADAAMEAIRLETLLRLRRGPHSVVALPGEDDDWIGDGLFLEAFAVCVLGFDSVAAAELPLKIREIGPQEVLAGVSLLGAISLKDELAAHHWPAAVRE